MRKVYGAVGNCLASSLNESLRNIVEGKHITSANGEKWSKHLLVKNERHTDFRPEKPQPKFEGVPHESQAQHHWVNNRTKMCTPHDLRMSPDGKVQPFSFDSSHPQMHHISAYFEKSEK